MTNYTQNETTLGRILSPAAHGGKGICIHGYQGQLRPYELALVMCDIEDGAVNNRKYRARGWLVPGLLLQVPWQMGAKVKR